MVQTTCWCKPDQSLINGVHVIKANYREDVSSSMVKTRVKGSFWFIFSISAFPQFHCLHASPCLLLVFIFPTWVWLVAVSHFLTSLYAHGHPLLPILCPMIINLMFFLPCVDFDYVICYPLNFRYNFSQLEECLVEFYWGLHLI